MAVPSIIVIFGNIRDTLQVFLTAPTIATVVRYNGSQEWPQGLRYWSPPRDNRQAVCFPYRPTESDSRESMLSFVQHIVLRISMFVEIREWLENSSVMKNQRAQEIPGAGAGELQQPHFIPYFCIL